MDITDCQWKKLRINLLNSSSFILIELKTALLIITCLGGLFAGSTEELFLDIIK